MSAFCRDCLTDAAETAKRCPACGSPSAGAACRTWQPHHRSCRLRRLLRHNRKARRSRPRRPAVDRRRRQARRRRHLLLCRAHLRRALGHADVQGAGTLPACRGRQAEHGQICRRRPRGAQTDAGADAAGRAAVDRRSVSRPDRHRAPAWHDRGQSAGALCAASGKRSRHYDFGRAVGQQISRQDRLRHGQAARLCRARPVGSGRAFWRPSRSASSMASARSARPGSPPMAIE